MVFRLVRMSLLSLYSTPEYRIRAFPSSALPLQRLVLGSLSALEYRQDVSEVNLQPRGYLVTVCNNIVCTSSCD